MTVNLVFIRLVKGYLYTFVLKQAMSLSSAGTANEMRVLSQRSAMEKYITTNASIIGTYINNGLLTSSSISAEPFAQILPLNSSLFPFIVFILGLSGQPVIQKHDLINWCFILFLQAALRQRVHFFSSSPCVYSELLKAFWKHNGWGGKIRAVGGQFKCHWMKEELTFKNSYNHWPEHMINKTRTNDE